MNELQAELELAVHLDEIDQQLTAVRHAEVVRQLIGATDAGGRALPLRPTLRDNRPASTRSALALDRPSIVG